MKKNLHSLTGVILCWLFAIPAHAKWDRPSIEKKLFNCMTENNIPGIAVVILKGEEVWMETAIGKRRNDQKGKLTSDTIFWDVPGILEALPYIMHQQKAVNLDGPIHPHFDKKDLKLMNEAYLKKHPKVEDWILTPYTPPDAYAEGVWSELGGVKLGKTMHSQKLRKKLLGPENKALKRYLYAPLHIKFHERFDSKTFVYMHRGNQTVSPEAPPSSIQQTASLHDSIQLLKLYLGKKPALLAQTLIRRMYASEKQYKEEQTLYENDIYQRRLRFINNKISKEWNNYQRGYCWRRIYYKKTPVYMLGSRHALVLIPSLKIGLIVLQNKATQYEDIGLGPKIALQLAAQLLQ